MLGNVSIAKSFIKILRPTHWIKNIFVFAPLVFTSQFLNADSVIISCVATIYFCLASSAAYVVNDLCDIEIDRRHPEKLKTRPLASGEISKSQALMLLLFLYLIIASGFLIFPTVTFILVAYLLLNIAYSMVLKHQPIVDIFSIGLGFVLRVYAGAMALTAPVSSWMFVTTLSLALFLASMKRRQELSLHGENGRIVLQGYTTGLLNLYAQISSTGALLFYSLFVMTMKPELVISIPFVVFGIFRYWYIVESERSKGSPTEDFISDWPLILTTLSWFGVCMWKLIDSAV